ncbi:MAG: hypothetical protein U0359_12960 [Byssovorax sp.]
MDTSHNATTPATSAARTGKTGILTGSKIALTSPEVPEGSGLPNFLAMGQRAATYWVFVVIAMLIGAAITRKAVKDRKFTYKSEAVLVYRGGIEGPPTQEMLKGAATRAKELLVSYNSLKKIIKECRLAPGLEATGNYGPMIEAMRLKIDFKPRAGDTYTLSYEGNSGYEARLVVTKLAEALIDFNAQERKRRLKGSIEFNLAEKNHAEEEMVRLQKEVALFLTEHPNVAGEQVGNGALIKAEIKKSKDKDKKERPARDDGPRAAAPKRQAGNAPAAAKKADDPALAVDPVLIAARTAARAEQLAARKDLADKSVRFTEQHPDVRAAQARVAAAEAALASADAAVEAAAAAAAQAAPPRPAAISPADPYEEPAAPARPRVAAGGGGAPRPAQTASSTPAVGSPDLIDLDAQWSQLNRQLQVATQNYSTLSAKLFTAQLADNTDESGYSAELDLLDPASKPTAPTGAPNRSMLSVGLGISVVVGILISIAFGLFLDDRIYASSEIDDLRVVPVLGVIPRSKPAKKPFRWRLRG